MIEIELQTGIIVRIPRGRIRWLTDVPAEDLKAIELSGADAFRIECVDIHISIPGLLADALDLPANACSGLQWTAAVQAEAAKRVSRP